VKATSYELVVERDASGSWIARIPAVPGCHTHARTLAQARRRIREALSLWVEGAEDAELREEIRLPRPVQLALQRSSFARAQAERRRSEAARAMTEAARALQELDLGMRDAAELLGISHQRVQQLVRR